MGTFDRLQAELAQQELSGEFSDWRLQRATLAFSREYALQIYAVVLGAPDGLGKKTINECLIPEADEANLYALTTTLDVLVYGGVLFERAITRYSEYLANTRREVMQAYQDVLHKT